MAQKAIGPNFSNELAAAGVIGQHFAWHADGTLEFFPDTPASVVTAVQAVYAAHDPTKPSPQAQLEAALASGVQVNSTATPALDGLHDFSPNGLLNISALQVSLNSGKALPNGATTVKIKDMAGAWHTFAEADLTNLAVALRDYVYNWDLYIGGQAASPPATPLTIA